MLMSMKHVFTSGLTSETESTEAPFFPSAFRRYASVLPSIMTDTNLGTDSIQLLLLNGTLLRATGIFTLQAAVRT